MCAARWQGPQSDYCRIGSLEIDSEYSQKISDGLLPHRQLRKYLDRERLSCH